MDRLISCLTVLAVIAALLAIYGLSVSAWRRLRPVLSRNLRNSLHGERYTKRGVQDHGA